MGMLNNQPANADSNSEVVFVTWLSFSLACIVPLNVLQLRNPGLRSLDA